MNKLIRYLIYKNYKWQLFVKMWNPIKSAIFAVIFPLGMVLLSLVILVLLYEGMGINYWVLLPVFIIAFFYEHHLNKKVSVIGIESIIEEFESKDEPYKKITMSLVLLYSLLAVFSPIIVSVLYLRVF